MSPAREPVVYSRYYMRKERAWRKGIEDIMRLRPGQRYDAAVQLHLRVHHEEIIRAHKYQTLFVELLERLRAAPDFVPFFDKEQGL
jgi:hypothetical protein